MFLNTKRPLIKGLYNGSYESSAYPRAHRKPISSFSHTRGHAKYIIKRISKNVNLKFIFFLLNYNTIFKLLRPHYKIMTIQKPRKLSAYEVYRYNIYYCSSLTYGNNAI